MSLSAPTFSLHPPSSFSELSEQVPHTIWQVVDVINGVISETHYSATYDIYAIDFHDPSLYYTAAAIFIAGVLASASGIGGGGIFVAVLMLCANFSPHQAVPLSKALIFSGAIMSFIVNIQKRDNRGERLIQVELVKNIVPMALGGTLFGVMLNTITPRAILVLCLALLLTFLTYKLVSQGIRAYNQENVSLAQALPNLNQDFNREAAVKNLPDRAETASTASSENGRGSVGGGGVEQMQYFDGRSTVIRSSGAVYRDVAIMIVILAAVIVCGSIRHTMDATTMLPNVILALGLGACISVAVLFRQPFMSTANSIGDNFGDDYVSVSYPIMAFCAGICSGLMGIGGGLIFAPFLMLNGVDPSKAVSTSATCVIFTASSTTLQYFFLGRVMIYQALFLGVVSFLSAIAGTKLVHAIKEHGRNSYLIFLVSLAVGISCVMVGFKGIKFAQEDWSAVHFHVAFGYWIAQICAATGWKLTTSMDDIMWLSPFLAQTSNSLAKTGAKLVIYVIVVQCVVLTASSVMWGSDYASKALSEQGHNINIHAYLLLFSGSLLSCYSLYLLREWFKGEDDEEDEEGDSKDFSTKRLIIVSFLGQLDELASFTTALLGGFFAPLSLSIGCLFACTMIASMTAGALKIQFIAKCILAVPVWAIIGTVSVYNICNGLSALINGP